MNVVEYKKLSTMLPQLKGSKYRNKRCEVDGLKFDSMKERNRWLDLSTMQKAGIINLLQRQVPFSIVINGTLVCKYVADFTYRVGGALVIEDAKSPIIKKEPVYRLKKKLMKAVLGLEIVEV